MSEACFAIKVLTFTGFLFFSIVLVMWIAGQIMLAKKSKQKRVYTVKEGSWYDPSVWDVGRCPRNDEIAVLRHNVKIP